MPFCLNSALFPKNNARNINFMTARIFKKTLFLNKRLILGQPPSAMNCCLIPVNGKKTLHSFQYSLEGYKYLEGVSNIVISKMNIYFLSFCSIPP
jgi:hypothetical protein